MAESNKNTGQGTQATQGWPNQGQGIGTQGTPGQGNSGWSGQQQNPGQAGQGTHGAAGGVGQMARDTASSAAHAASGLIHAAGEKAEHAAETVAGGMRSLAGSVRENAPAQGMLGTAAGTVADTLEGGSHYLEHGGFHHLLDDVSGAIRRNPIPCMLCTLAVGFVLGRLLTFPRSSNSRSF